MLTAILKNRIENEGDILIADDGLDEIEESNRFDIDFED